MSWSKFTRAPRFSGTSQTKLTLLYDRQLGPSLPWDYRTITSNAASVESSYARESREPSSRPVFSHRAENPQSKP
jgi:hypothetical protein